MHLSPSRLPWAAAIVGFLTASPLLAQQQDNVESSNVLPISQTAPASAAEPQWRLKATHGQWGVMCNVANPNDCRAAQTQNSSDENSPGRLLQVLLTSENDRTFGILTLPFGVDLRAGIALQIDGGSQFNGTIITCLPDGCQSIVEFDQSAILQLTAGTTMRVGFRPWGQESSTLVIDVPLDGVAQALSEL